MADKTAAEQAYQAALDEIARVRKAGGGRLNLSGKTYAALDRIPPEVQGIEGLVSLDLIGTNIRDLSPLRDLTALRSLWLSQTAVSDLSPLRDLTALQFLSLGQTAVSDLTPLRDLTALHGLWLNQTAVSDLSPLRDLTALQELSLDQTAVSDLSPLRGLTALQYLRLDQTAVSDLSPLRGLTALQSLSLRQTVVSDLSPLHDLTALQRLFLSQTTVSDLSPLRDLTALQFLSLDQTAVSDLSPLRGLTALQRLFLSQTAISDLSPLRGLTALQYLQLDQTAVSDLSPLRDMTKLRSLWLHHSKVADLRPVAHLDLLGSATYTELSFHGTPAAAADPVLARLAQSGYHRKRTRETLAYLKTLPPWPEPLPGAEEEPGAPPEQDPALPLIWGEKGFAFLARSIDADPVTEAALEDLRALLEDLRRKGNRHDDLYRLAGEMLERSAGEIADLHMVRLHLSYQKMRRLYQSRGSRADAFDDETVGVLGSVLEILPGVTLADPGVEKLIQRQEAERLAGTSPETAAAEAAVLQAVQTPDAPFADEVKDAASAILQPCQNDRLAATRGVLSRNSLIAVLRFLRHDPVGAGITSSLVTTFVLAYSPALLAVAGTMGTDAFLWAQMVMAGVKSEYQLAAGVAREALSAGALPRPGQGRRDRE